MVARAERELSEPHASGTATACIREILSTIGSALHGSTAATASNLAMLSSALGINGVTLFVVRFAELLAVDDSIVVVVVVVAVVLAVLALVAQPFPSPIVVDHRLAFAGEQLA